MFKKFLFFSFISVSFSFCSVKKQKPDLLNGIDFKWEINKKYKKLKAIKGGKTVSWAQKFENGAIRANGDRKYFDTLFDKIDKAKTKQNSD